MKFKASRLSTKLVFSAGLALFVTACELPDGVQRVSGVPGQHVKMEFQTSTGEYGTYLFEWQCVTGEREIEFIPNGGGKAWKFVCEPFLPEMPNKILGGHRARKVLRLRGSLLVPRDQNPGVVEGHLRGRVNTAHMTESRHFIVKTTSVYHDVWVTVK